MHQATCKSCHPSPGRSSHQLWLLDTLQVVVCGWHVGYKMAVGPAFLGAADWQLEGAQLKGISSTWFSPERNFLEVEQWVHFQD